MFLEMDEEDLAESEELGLDVSAKRCGLFYFGVLRQSIGLQGTPEMNSPGVSPVE